MAPLKLLGNVRFGRIQSIRVVNLLIVDVHFNIGKYWVQNVVYMSNERNWCLLQRRLLLVPFYLLIVLPSYFFAIVNFVTTTPDKFQLQSHVGLSQINVIAPIRSKFKLYSVFIEWGSRIDFLFRGWQDIVNYWHFSSKVSRNCHKRLVPKITRHDYWEIFVKVSLLDRLICFADFVGMSLHAVFPPATTAQLFFPSSGNSGAANSNKSAPRCFAAGTIFSRTNGIAAFPINCASAPNPRPRCLPTPLQNGISTCLEATVL